MFRLLLFAALLLSHNARAYDLHMYIQHKSDKTPCLEIITPSVLALHHMNGVYPSTVEWLNDTPNDDPPTLHLLWHDLTDNGQDFHYANENLILHIHTIETKHNEIIARIIGSPIDRTIILHTKNKSSKDLLLNLKNTSILIKIHNNKEFV